MRQTPREAAGWMRDCGIVVDDSMCWSLEAHDEERLAGPKAIASALVGTVVILGVGWLCISALWFALGGK